LGQRFNPCPNNEGNRGGKSELSRARCHVTRGPARDGKCHRKQTGHLAKGEKVV